MKKAPIGLFVLGLASCWMGPLHGQTTLIGGAVNNGHLDFTYPQEILPGFFLAKPAVWLNVATRAISGPTEDDLQSEPWAGPAPTPVTAGGSGDSHPNGCGGPDCGVFFKAFAGNAPNGAITAHLYQDRPAVAGATYVLTGWAGGEANFMAAGAEIALQFLDAGNDVIPSSGQIVNLMPTLNADNGQPFEYKRYVAYGVAPPDAENVRVRVSMLGGVPNPAGGGQAFVVDDFTLIEDETLFADGFESGNLTAWSNF